MKLTFALILTVILAACATMPTPVTFASLEAQRKFDIKHVTDPTLLAADLAVIDAKEAKLPH